MVDGTDQRDDCSNHNTPEAGHCREVHVGNLVQLEVEERSKGFLRFWQSVVQPGGWTVLNRGGELSTPSTSIVGLSLPCHSLSETHPAGEDEGGEGANEGAHLVAIGEEHAENKGTKHRAAHDAEDAKSSLKNAREVLDHEHDPVADDAEAHGQQLCGEGGLRLCQLDITARLYKVPKQSNFEEEFEDNTAPEGNSGQRVETTRDC